MKKIKTGTLVTLLALILVITLIPSFITRVTNEQKNKNVVVSLYYNDIANHLTGEKLDNAIDDFYDIGVTVASLSEENINSMVARGDITNIKHNVLRHKYDDESLELARIIEQQAPDVIYDSQLLITKDSQAAQFLRNNLPNRFSEDEYTEIAANNGITVFCIYDGTLPTSELLVGYDEEAIVDLKERGYEICLVVKIQDNKTTRYLEKLDELIKKYDVKYLSVRSSLNAPENDNDGKLHYEGVASILKNNDLTLVVTENPSQLSNEKPFGYDKIFEAGSKKVLRSYETYDASQDDSSHYLFRYQQYLNSTIDRNIRFITLSQIYLTHTPYEKLNEYTLLAAEEYINKIKELGFTVGGEDTVFDYNVNLTPICAIAAAIMVLLVYLMIAAVFNLENKKLMLAFIILAVFAAGITFVMPESLLSLYSTAWAVIMPCFGMTAVMSFAKTNIKRFSAIQLSILTPVILAVIMSIGGIVMSSLLSGIDYYVNNDVFRGIKLSLFLPLVYSVAIYYLMFVKKDGTIIGDIKTIAKSDIKVYWIIIAAAIGFVGLTYLRRSGNVNSISSIEAAMRSFITEHFNARPRTKEFLIGYPCIVLFIYYLKKVDIKLVQAILAAGGAIVAASISNSFCHVFTDASTIYMRVLNGVLLAVPVCIAAYLGNLILVKAIKLIYRYVKAK